jgi:cobalt/nickel transport system permease protein
VTRTWEPYLPGFGPIHRLDPRLKLLATLGTVLTATLVPAGDWASLVALALLVATAVALSRLSVSTLLGRTALALPFVLLATLSVPFARQGQPLWSAHVGPLALAITNEGLVACGSILARAWLSLWAATLLVATTPLPGLQHALWLLRVPPILCSTIALMIRYLYVLVDEASRLMCARASRSAGPARSVGWRARVLGGMIGSLLIRSVARAERIHAAMLARGYDGTPRVLHRLSWKPSDTRAALLWSAGLLGALALAIP